MRDARFGDTASLPEGPKIEIIVESLDPNCRKEDDPESDCKSLLDHACEVEDHNEDNQSHHE